MLTEIDSQPIFQECHEWQAAFRVCMTGPRQVAQAIAAEEKRAEEARAADAALKRAENERKAAAAEEAQRERLMLQLLQSANDDLTKVCASKPTFRSDLNTRLPPSVSFTRPLSDSIASCRRCRSSNHLRF